MMMMMMMRGVGETTGGSIDSEVGGTGRGGMMMVVTDLEGERGTFLG